MFRVITDFVASPTLFVLCDHPHCGNYTAQQLDEPLNGNASEKVNLFVEARKLEGWVVQLDNQYCPGHVRATQELQKMISVPKPRIVLPG